MIGCRTRSSAGRSITRLCTRISNLSKVAVPLPHGDLRVVTFMIFVGRGIGPRMMTPVRVEISRIISMILFSAPMSTLLNLILTFPIL